jgi:hypothetical protein
MMYCINFHLNIFSLLSSKYEKINLYNGVNYFITILGFSIYKSYYLSEQKTKNVNVYKKNYMRIK